MKKLILLMMLANTALAYQLNITQMTKYPNYEVNFKLTGQDIPYYAQLNCQSFFQKFDVYSKDHKLLNENYISIGECEYIYNNLSQCLATHKTKCIDTADLFNPSCSCEN